MAGLVYNSGTNEVLRVISFPHKALEANGPYYEIDPAKIKDLTLALIRNLGFAKRVQGIGISTQMHGCLFVDARNRPQTPLITWQDQRCLQPYPGNKNINYLQKIEETAGKRIFYGTGTEISSGFLGPTTFWFSERKLLPRGTRVCFLGDYVASALTGEAVSPDITCAGSSGFFDIKNKTWLWPVLGKLGVPAEIFPPIGETGSILGYLNAEIAALTGLSRGIPVLRAVGDNQASIFGAAGQLRDSLLINIGTGSQISVRIENFMRREGLDTRYFPKDDYVLVGAALCGGRALKIAEKFFLQAGKELFGSEKKALHREFDKLLKSYRGPVSEMVCAPLFAGTRDDTSKSGFFANIREENFNLPCFLYALMEGLIFELYSFSEKMKAKGAKEIVGSGNGLRRSPVLGEIVANLFGKPLKISNFEEEAALGSCFLAARRLEKPFTLERALKNMGYARIILPQPDKAKIFQDNYKKYKKFAILP